MSEFASKQPYWFSIGIFAVVGISAIPFVLLFNVLGIPQEPLRVIIPIAQSLLVIVILHLLGWLSSAGFGNRIRSMHVLWFPLVLAFIPALLYGSVEIAAYGVFFYTIALLFTGISEEGEARAIILRVLLPKGKWIALIFAAALFSVGHFTNLFFEAFNALEMIEKLTVTFGFAMLYGAIYMRTLNLSVLIILHMLHDFILVISGTAGPFVVEPISPILHIALSVASLAYGVFLIRDVDAKDVLKAMNDG